jgi:siroheme decarboxylase
MLSELDQKVILALQRDLEICPQPFLELAEYLGIAEAELLATIRSLMARGYIRRFGATLRHQQSGYEANALVAWAVPEADLRRIGQHLAGHRAVSHCYARRPAPTWPYNLYTMIHGRTPDECIKIAAAMAAATGLKDYEMLFSEIELKKTTMRYFKEGETQAVADSGREATARSKQSLSGDG